MAIGKGSDFKIYDDYFHAGRTEILMQETDAFNAASGNVIQLKQMARLGNYGYESFYDVISSLDSRRDVTSTSSVTPLAMTQDENVSVKINRKQGPVSQTLDSFKKKGRPADEMSFVLGQQSAKAQMARYLNSSLTALVGAIGTASSGALEFDATDGTLQYTDMVSGMALAGDKGDDLAAIVTHSKTFYNLFGDGISNYKIDRVAGASIVTGVVGTMGRPIIVTDSTSLVDSSGSTTYYYTLLLYPGAAVVEESEDDTLASEIVTGAENLYLQWQYEYAYNLSLRGFKWDVTNGGANPTDTALGTGTNWDKAATDDKSLAGVMIKSQ